MQASREGERGEVSPPRFCLSADVSGKVGKVGREMKTKKSNDFPCVAPEMLRGEEIGR